MSEMNLLQAVTKIQELEKRIVEFDLNRGCLTSLLEQCDKKIRELETTLELRCELKDTQIKNYKIDIEELETKLDKLEHRFEDEQIKSCHLQHALKDFPFYRLTQYAIMHKLENIENQ